MEEFWKKYYCPHTFEFLRAGGEDISVRPTALFDYAEAAFRNLRNVSQQSREQLGEMIRPAVETLPSSVHFKLFEVCPPFFMTAWIIMAILNLGSHQDSLMRVAHMASLAHPHVIAQPQHISIWRKIFERRWKILHHSPGFIWKTLGCEPHEEPLTISGLLARPPRPEQMSCLDRFSTFSPSSFFQSAPPGANRTPSELYDAMRPHLDVQPMRFGSMHLYGLLEFVLQHHLHKASLLQGLLFEFGVFNGNTINLTARHVQSVWQEAGKVGPLPIVHGFDSFRGLPRNWHNHDVGTFGMVDGQPVGMPPVEPNVELVVGWFNETLQPFLQGVGASAHVSGTRLPTVSLAHLDADLYESTALVLRLLLPFLSSGSILVFDDLFKADETDSADKENWDAFFETLQLEEWRWNLQVLVAPWHFGNAVSHAAAFRLVSV